MPPGWYTPLIIQESYDVLVELVPGGTYPLNAYGNTSALQGMLRHTTAVDLTGTPVPNPQGPLPLTLGYQYLVAGKIYPKGSLDVCKAAPTQPCNPSNNSIGNWLCSGWTLADANETPWPQGKALNYATIFFNISEGQYKGTFVTTTLEPSAFMDVGTKSSFPVSGGTGSFIHAKGLQASSYGFLGAAGFAPGLRIGFRYTVSTFPK